MNNGLENFLLTKLLPKKKYNWNWFVVTDGINGIHVINKNNEYKQFQQKSERFLM